MAVDSDQSHKAHRLRQSGASAKKKGDSSGKDKKKNPKAFAFSSSNKAKRLQSRAVEKKQRRLHVPTIDRTYGEPAPYVVLVQGPPQVGKSLLIKSLVKHYTKHNLPEVQGPITIVSGKKRRVQFVECPNDINGMIDAAKYADLALLLIDGSYGFEMETFEFLNILQVHGFPKVMGVLTHLDTFKDAKKLRKTKQRLKHRFWTEIYNGAKLFYLSGLQYGKYHKREIHNLSRFISVMKFHPLSWRAAHPYILVDRFEDVTPPERVHLNKKCDRNITLYGYLRGCNMKRGTKVHVAGVGDYSLATVSGLVDPCPLPSAAKKKGLRDKEKLYYAPMSGLGDLLYDKDAVYVNINDHFVQFSQADENGQVKQKGKDDDVGETLVKYLQKTKYSIDEKLEKSFITLFGQKATLLSESENNAKDTYKAGELSRKIEPSMQNGPGEAMEVDVSGKESDSENSDGSESSDQNEAAQRDEIIGIQDDVSDEEDNAPEQGTHPKDHMKEHVEFHGGRRRRKVIFEKDIDDDELKDLDEDDNDDAENQTSFSSDSSEDDGKDYETGEDMGNISRWKESLIERTISRQTINLMQLVYGKSAKPTSLNEEQDSSDDEESGDEFFKPKGDGNKKPGEAFEGENFNSEDCSKFTNLVSLRDWKDDELVESIRDRFVTGDWSKAAQRNQTSNANAEDDDDLYGDFEDLETGEKHDGSQNNAAGNGKDQKEDELAEERRQKKILLRAKFDAQYDGNDLMEEEREEREAFDLSTRRQCGSYLRRIMAGEVAAGTGGAENVPEMLKLVNDVVGMCIVGGPFKKDCTDLIRRIALLTHLFEELREFKGAKSSPFDALASSSSSSSSRGSWVSDLMVALQAAKGLLLVASNSRSKNVPTDGGTKKIAFQFQSVTWKLEKALANLPYDLFDISEEVQEHVELVRAQLRRATERYGCTHSKKLSFYLSEPLESETRVELESRANELHRENSCGTDQEVTVKLDAILRSDSLKSLSVDQITYRSEILRKSKSTPELCSTNDNDADGLENQANKGENKKSDGIVIPDDFLCPISLELMRDPVIVSTGQTYERSYIQRWIDCGNKTCPKTQQKLEHVTLTPNYVLRSLISQWCLKHNIEQPTGLANGKMKKSDGSFRDVSGDIAVIEALVRKLSSRSIEERRAAVTEIRSLSKRSTDNRILIAEAGAIPILVNLLTSDDVVTQENAVTSVLNLSIYENNKGLIMLAGAIPSIVQVLRAGTMEARENAAATLFSLSLGDENKIIIGASGAILALVELLQNGSPRGMKDAATALFNLCIYQGNKGRAVRAGIVTALLKMLSDSDNGMIDEALTIMSVLASHQEAKLALVKAGTIPVLIDLLRTGLPRNKENAAAILLALCKRENENLACISRLGAVIPLTELAQSGTERAKRKATSLLEHLRKLQQP